MERLAVNDLNKVCYFARGEWPFCTLDNFGKNVFLTREEAEASLKELEGE